MRGNETWLAVVAIAMVLIINGRALAAQQLPRNRLVKLALVWLGIIVVVALIARSFAG